MNPIIDIQNVGFSYGENRALNGVSFQSGAGQIFGLLGPNGSGKTTLFRILATLLKPDQGTVTMGGLNLIRDFRAIRKKIGIVFQAPSLDLKLTVHENILFQGYVYGLSGRPLRARAEEMMARLGIADRAKQKAGALSGGLKRRVELAKGLMHRPEILLLDEPSTGLDPAARLDLWNYLQLLTRDGLTVGVTTHLMDEAEYCRQLVIMASGKVVATGSPQSLKAEMGGDIVILKSSSPVQLHEKIKKQFHITGLLTDSEIQLEHVKGSQLAMKIIETFPGEVDALTFRHPTLEDVFVHKTGYQFWNSKS